MIRLIAFGLLSGLFFSSTFILNRVMSLEGGSWVWSASLRYLFMIIFLFALISALQGAKATVGVGRLFLKNWIFWCFSGSVGFGGFYALLCYSADHAPGWIVASTWQLTIIASLVVLVGFGRKFPKKIWLFSSLVLAGVLMVNLSHAEAVNAGGLLRGALPVLLAAFCYPLGNQLVWEAKNANPRLPDISSPLLENPFNKVMLLSLGSIPFWCVLIIVTAPPPPSAGQLLNTALVALFSGIFATSLFLYARNRAVKPSELAAVDATQSSEVLFAMAGEVAFLGAALPNGVAIAGIAIAAVGLALFIRYQEKDLEVAVATEVMP